MQPEGQMRRTSTLPRLKLQRIDRRLGRLRPTSLADAATIELEAAHLLVLWPVVRLVLDLLGIYGLMALGWHAGRIVRPHFVDRGVLPLRSRPHVCARISLYAVADV